MTAIGSVCVYCGSSQRVAPAFRRSAGAIGRRLAADGITLVYGGGRVGLMGEVADGALAAGGQVVGFIPEHLYELEAAHTGLTELHVVDGMHTRKMGMFERSDGFLVLPGGLGTLDEMMEVLTWKQLGLHRKPVVLLDVQGYWRPLIAMVEAQIAAGFARPEHRDLFTVADSYEAALEAMRQAPPPLFTPISKWA